MTVQSITYPEGVVLNLRDELERALTRVRELETERSESDGWASLSSAREAAHRAQQQVIEATNELERTRQELSKPIHREFSQLKVHCEALERKVAEQSGRIAELEAKLQDANPTRLERE